MLRSCIEWRSRGDLFGKCCHTKIRRSFRYRLIMVSLPGEKMREGGKYEDLKIAIPVGKNRRHRNLENNKRHNEKKTYLRMATQSIAARPVSPKEFTSAFLVPQFYAGEFQGSTLCSVKGGEFISSAGLDAQRCK